MNTLTQRLQDWLDAHLPEVAGDLNTGSSDSELTALEQQLGKHLPETSKRCIAGMTDNVPR